MKNEEALKKFLRRCNADGLLPSTLRFYEFAMKGLFKFCSKIGVSEIDDISEDVMYDYFADIQHKYAPPTISGRWLAFSAFFGWLLRSGHIVANPLDAVRKPKKRKRIIYSFSNSEINEILGSYDKNTFIGFRNYTIMSVLLGTGIRKAELLGLRPESVDFDTNTLLVLGKGNKERLVPFGNKLEAVIRRYLRMRNQYLVENSWSCNALFITKDGGALSEWGVNTIFNTLRKNKKKWSTRVSPHTFRHTYAKLFLLNGGDLFSLQKILGHTDVTTTKIYVDFNDNEIRTQASRYNPLDNNRWKYT